MGRTAAPPEAVDLGTAAPPGRPRRRGRIVVALVAVGALVVAGLVVLATRGDPESATDDRVDTFAPDVTVGDADLTVISTTADRYGARAPIPADLVTRLGAVEGVEASEGVLRAFLPVRTPDDHVLGGGRSTIALSWNGTAGLELREGHPPTGPNEIAIEQTTLEDAGLHVGDTVRLPAPNVAVTGPSSGDGLTDATIVGAFTLAGGEAGVHGVAVTALDAATLLTLAPNATGTAGFDRVDLIVAADADPNDVLQQVVAVLPQGTTVVPATQLGSREQLRAELEIQRAFFDLLSHDEPTRNATIEGGDQATPEARAQGAATFDRYLSQVDGIEFRVQRVSFLDADHARLVFMTYYGGNPSPVLNEPFDAGAVRVDGTWKISADTVCTLSLLGGSPCVRQPGHVVPPPPKWDAPSAHADVVAAITAATPPGTTLVVSGARLSDPTHAQVFYSLTAPDRPDLETPYPLIAELALEGGRWAPTSPPFSCPQPGAACGVAGVVLSAGGAVTTSTVVGSPAAGPPTTAVGTP